MTLDGNTPPADITEDIDADNRLLPTRERIEGAQSLVMYRVGGKMYPMHVSARCKVCNSPHRLRIEQEMVAGRGFSFIVKALPDDADLSPNNLRNHYEGGHLPSDLSIVRELVEQRARERGDAIETGQATMVDGISFMRTVQTKAFERIANGEVKVSVEQGLAAAQFLESLGVNEVGADQAAYTEAFVIYYEGLHRFFDPEAIEQYLTWLSQHPLLQSLIKKAEERRRGTAIDVSADTSILDAPKDA